MPIKILRPSLDDLNETTVLRGIIDRDSLDELKNDYYQREKLSQSSRHEIITALETGTQLPDIELGMRGDSFQIEGEGNMQVVVLLDPVYIIDGRQRIETLKDFIKEWPEAKAHLGAIVHFNSDVDWEKRRFQTLNTSRVKVSPNILLRNIKDDFPSIATLYGLSRNQADFPLYRRVSWQQNMMRDELLSALTVTKIALRIHAHLAPTRQVLSSTSAGPIGERVIARVGLPIFRQNISTFWAVVDECWDIRNITQRRTSLPQLNYPFLAVLADILSDHVDFWAQPDELRLQIPYELKSKLKKFPIYDPEIARLSGAHGKATETLYFIMTSHINSGKRTRRLVPRNVRATIPPIMEEDNDAEEEVA